MCPYESDDPGDRLERAMSHGRELHRQLLEAESRMNPKPPPLSGALAFFLKAVPVDVVKSAITDIGKGLIEARRAGKEPDQPQEVLPTPVLSPGRAKPDRQPEISGFVGFVDEAKPVLPQ